MNAETVFRRWSPWLFGALALVPLLAGWRSFSDLFFFGDDWDHIERLETAGLWPWAWTTFAENFIPLFKFAWGGLLLASGGSHMTLVVALWLTHAAVTGLLARTLVANGAGMFATALAATVFGLSSINIETLAWTTQWTTVLAVVFLLGAFAWAARTGVPAVAPMTWDLAVPILLVTGSALSMVRGILAGPVLAAVFLWPAAARGVPWSRRLIRALLVLAPCLLVAGVVALRSGGNHHEIGRHNVEMLRFALAAFALDPLHPLGAFDSLGWRTIVILGLAKTALVAWGLHRAGGRLRHLLWMFVLFDLGNAVLLGIGRFHTGLNLATSSRYQYTALLCLAPFLGLAAQAALDRVIHAGRLRYAAAIVVVAAAAWFAGRNWPRDIDGWAAWRGRNVRELVLGPEAPPAEATVPGIPFMPAKRARELAAQHDLH